MTKPTTQDESRPRLSAWRFVATFGVISLLADFVYEGARSITGPLLAELGATALTVGIVTGMGEAAALMLRLVSGPLADHTRRFWAWTIAGYALTVISVPLLGFAGVLWVAATLVILERAGKAIRSPAKDALLSFATAVTGRGKGFAVHEAIDQFGAVIGPLVVAAMLALTGDDYGPSLAILAIPGVLALGLLLTLARKAPHPEQYEPHAELPVEESFEPVQARRLTPRFWAYAGFAALTTTGFATFGVLSFHMVAQGLIPAALVPVVYAAVMLVDAGAALASGWAYDRIGARTLLILPVIAAALPLLAFSNNLAMVIAGALAWGAALGIQEATLRATVADLVPRTIRSTAYGIFAVAVGVGTALGGAIAGWLYETSLPTLITATIIVQAAALAIGALFLGRRPR